MFSIEKYRAFLYNYKYLVLLGEEGIFMALLRENQLSIMMFMSGVCGILAIMTLFSKSLPRRRKKILATMEFAAMMLLLFDRFCYMFRGDVTELGYFMVRICNGAVFGARMTGFLFDVFQHDIFLLMQ